MLQIQNYRSIILVIIHKAMTPTKTPTHGFLIRTAILLVHPVKLHTLNNALTFLLVIYFIRTKLMYDNIHKMLVFIENLTKPFSRHATYKILIPFHITYIKKFSFRYICCLLNQNKFKSKWR